MLIRYLYRVKRCLFGASQYPFSVEGVEYYKPGTNGEMNAGLQSYCLENLEGIRKGNVPERYLRIARIVPGQAILEIGSADGTQCSPWRSSKKCAGH